MMGPYLQETESFLPSLLVPWQDLRYFLTSAIGHTLPDNGCSVLKCEQMSE